MEDRYLNFYGVRDNLLRNPNNLGPLVDRYAWSNSMTAVGMLKRAGNTQVLLPALTRGLRDHAFTLDFGDLGAERQLFCQAGGQHGAKLAGRGFFQPRYRVAIGVKRHLDRAVAQHVGNDFDVDSSGQE